MVRNWKQEDEPMYYGFYYECNGLHYTVSVSFKKDVEEEELNQYSHKLRKELAELKEIDISKINLLNPKEYKESLNFWKVQEKKYRFYEIYQTMENIRLAEFQSTEIQ